MPKKSYSFPADMSISPMTVQALVNSGWDIIRVNNVLPPASSDEAILDFARINKKIIITLDLDCSTLLAVQGFSHQTVITLRLPDSNPTVVTQLLLKTWNGIIDYFDGYAVTITEKEIRARKLPIEL